MGTRARIGVVNPSGSIKSIYTHWDGYPSHHGAILTQHYKTLPSARALMALGDLSALGESLGEKQDFDAPASGACLAYGRDRGETGVGAKLSKDRNHFASMCSGCWAEYAYLFDRGEWRAYVVRGTMLVEVSLNNEVEVA